MKTKLITIDESTGTHVNEIAKYILKNYEITEYDSVYLYLFEEWLMENNENKYNFLKGKDINIPESKNETIEMLFVSLPTDVIGESFETTLKNWTLTMDGNLLQGEFGYLEDENGFYILKDGRRVLEKDIILGNKDLRIGDKDPLKGFKSIMGIDENEKITLVPEYDSETLLKKYGKSPYKMSDIVFQALQINICYKDMDIGIEHVIKTEKAIANYYQIGTDETGIPIVVTRIGQESATNKLVVSGPHGDERNAQVLIIDTQRYFIENGLKPQDLVIYFVPSISPTTFFADARGLPLVDDDGKLYHKTDSKGAIEEAVKIALEKRGISEIHDFIAKKVKGNLMRANIQLSSLNGSPLSPNYGIDTNRDYYDALPSTRAFKEYFTSTARGLTGTNSTIFMIHGYDKGSRKSGGSNDSQSTVYGPYKPTSKNKDKGEISKQVENYTNFILVNLVGYQYTSKFSHFFDNSDVITGFEGEWGRKLYKDDGSGLICFDIELGWDIYNEGVRKGWPNYNAQIVGNTSLPFFNKDTKAKLLDASFSKIEYTNGYEITNTISFYDFLEIYFERRDYEIKQPEKTN